MQELLLKLYEVSGTSKGKLSFNAALLYNNIDEDLRPSKKKWFQIPVLYFPYSTSLLH